MTTVEPAQSQPSPREQLLGRVVAHVAEHGLSDVSLRELASNIGTSHRMLIYHFGSREGLIAAIVTFVETSQRDAMKVLVSAADSPGDVIRGLWEQVSSAQLLPFVRLFYELLPYALHRRAGTEAFRDSLVEPWVEAAMTIAVEREWQTNEVELRLGIAATRGLLVDLLATGDLEATSAAVERFIQMWESGDR